MIRHPYPPVYSPRISQLEGKPFVLPPENELHEFSVIVARFIDAFNRNTSVTLVEADEDEEFTYGAFCTALATIRSSRKPIFTLPGVEEFFPQTAEEAREILTRRLQHYVGYNESDWLLRHEFGHHWSVKYLGEYYEEVN